jgi:hypothetical protein
MHGIDAQRAQVIDVSVFVRGWHDAGLLRREAFEHGASRVVCCADGGSSCPWESSFTASSNRAPSQAACHSSVPES